MVWPAVGDLIEDGGDAGVHEEVGGVARVVGQRLELHEIPRGDGDHRLESGIEETPVHRRRRGGEEVVHPAIMPADERVGAATDWRIWPAGCTHGE